MSSEQEHLGLNLDTTTWEVTLSDLPDCFLQGWMNTQLVWASTEPWTFLSYVLLLLSPCFCVSAMLSWRLGQQIEERRKRRERKKKET